MHTRIDDCPEFDLVHSRRKIQLRAQQWCVFASDSIARRQKGFWRHATTAHGYAPTGTGIFTGWTIGGGIEQKITSNVSWKVEYQHFDFGTQAGYQISLVDDPRRPPATRFYNWTTVRADSVKIGLNWEFGK